MNSSLSHKLSIIHILFLFFILIYLLLPNNDQGNDSYSYALDARDGKELIHPHHLLYSLFGFILYQLFKFTGFGSMKILSLANLIFGVIALILIYRITKSYSTKFMAITGTLLIGFLFSFWYYSTSVEVNMPALMFLLLALFYLIVKQRPMINAILVYVFLSASILCHQIMALAVLPILIYDINRSRSFSETIKLALPGLLLGLFIYMAIALTQTSEKSIIGIYRWLTLYGHLDAWGSLQAINFTASAWGLLKTFFGGDVIRQVFFGGAWSLTAIIYLIAVAVFSIAMLWLVVVAIRKLFKTNDACLYLLLSLAIIYSLFAFWWAPADDGFWLYPIVMLIIFIFSFEHSSSAGNKILEKVSFSALVILVFLNVSFEFIPAADKNNSVFWRGATAFNRLGLTSDDLALTSYSQMRKAYNYHYNIYLPTTCVLYQQKGDKDEIIRNYYTIINDALQKGRVIVFENEIYPEPELYYMFERFSLEEYVKIYSPYLDYLMPVDSIMVHGKNVRLYEIAAEAIETGWDTE